MVNLMDWNPPPKPAELTEKRLIEAILDGHFQINSTLPAERELAEQIGVTRPTLREALQRLARDGWLEINQGKPTRIRNYWVEGNLAVLAEIARHQDHLPADFITNLLSIRKLMAPTYAQLAIQNEPIAIIHLLEWMVSLPNDPTAYANSDWELHNQLTISSCNPIFTLILNGFRDLYPVIGLLYFQSQYARDRSRLFYQELLDCAHRRDTGRAFDVTNQVMCDSLEIWRSINNGGS